MKDGVRYPIYRNRDEYDYQTFYDKVALVIERDKHICQKCGATLSQYEGVVHHLDFDKRNNHLNNLILLCFHCHRLGSTHTHNKRTESDYDIARDDIWAFPRKE